MSDSPQQPKRYEGRVIEARRFSATGYQLTFERKDLPFSAGQLITVHGADPLDDRSYTICSGERDRFLQILYRVIAGGRLTPQLVELKPGDPIHFSGPFGEFVLRDHARPIVFIATGTGIAPARSYVRTHPSLRLTLIHGVRKAEDLFYSEEFVGTDYFPCVSGEAGAGFRGRVTDFCALQKFPSDAHFYLCGSNEMFYDMRDVLAQQGVGPDRIFTEAYYYRADD